MDDTPPSPDLDFGDYTPGRFMIRAENPRRFAKPIPWRGAQGLFDVPDDVIAAALTQDYAT